MLRQFPVLLVGVRRTGRVTQDSAAWHVSVLRFVGVGYYWAMCGHSLGAGALCRTDIDSDFGMAPCLSMKSVASKA